nr:hypothetical protein [Tanacetum cinerariifolium]
MSVCKISCQYKRITPHGSKENLQVLEGYSHSWLDYNNGTYEAPLQLEVMKAELLKLGLHNQRNKKESASDLVNKAPLFKTWFLTACRILMTFVIQSTRFEVSAPDYNEGNTSSEMESDTQPPIQSFQDLKFLIEDSKDDLKELSDEEVYEDGD